MKNKYKNLIKNTSIFALGSFGSKVLTFLIIPLYTYVLTTEEYGTIDLFTSTINLMLPFATMLIYEAAIRFGVAKECDNGVIFNNCMLVFFIGTIISTIFALPLLNLLDLKDLYVIYIPLLILNSYNVIFSQYLRGIRKIWEFSISGILITVFTLLFNVIFLVFFHLGMNGYLYSLLIAQLISGFFIFISCKTISVFNLKLINIKILKNMLVYSLPLIPNNIMWWIMNAGDKYIINFYLGSSANGIFSLSYKIPTIISTIFSIFMQAWQISAIEEKNDNNRNDFYKNIFQSISFIMILTTAFIIVFIKPIFINIINSDYVNAWKYTPLLCLATIFNCFSTFAGIVYIVNKKSYKSLTTTFAGAIINLFFNIILIKNMSLTGVAIGTIFGYLVVMLIRFRDSKKYFGFSFMNTKLLLSLIILLTESIVYIYMPNIVKYPIAILCIILIICLHLKNIKKILFNLRKKENHE